MPTYYQYKPLDFQHVEDGYAYVAETFWGSVVLIRMSDDDEGIWLRFHYEHAENIGDEDGFYNKLLYVYNMEDAIKEANEIYENLLSQQFQIVAQQNTSNNPADEKVL